MKLKVTDPEELSEFIKKLKHDGYTADWVESFDLSETLSGPAVVEIEESDKSYIVRIAAPKENGFDNEEEPEEEFKPSFKLDTTAAGQADLFKGIFKDNGSKLDELKNIQKKNLMVIHLAKQHELRVAKNKDGNLFMVVKGFPDENFLILECVDPDQQLFTTKIVKDLTLI